MNNNSRILVTGHRGFVGLNLLSKLKTDSYTNLVYKSHSEYDLTSQVEVKELFTIYKPEYVFMCAAVVGGIQANQKDPYRFLIDNLRIQNNILEACAWSKHLKKVIFLGSSCCYPSQCLQPMKEEYILQSHPEITNEAYALAKICGLKLCQYINKQYNAKCISLIPPNLYGYGDTFDPDRSHVMSALIKKICDAKANGDNHIVVWGTGKAEREFLFIDDLISGMLWSADNLEKTDTWLNIGTGESISIKDLAELICKIVGFKGEIQYDTTKPDGMMKKCMDVSKIHKLGWTHKVSLEDGIEKTVRYYAKSSK